MNFCFTIFPKFGFLSTSLVVKSILLNILSTSSSSSFFSSFFFSFFSSSLFSSFFSSSFSFSSFSSCSSSSISFSSASSSFFGIMGSTTLETIFSALGFIIPSPPFIPVTNLLAKFFNFCENFYLYLYFPKRL